MKDNNIEQSGVVMEVREGLVVVQIVSTSMCSACHAKGACNSSDSKDKDIHVRTKDYGSYKEGDLVVVYMEKRLGFKAVFLGFVLPFLIMISSIILLKTINPNTQDINLALLGIASLIVYYVLLHLLRDRIESRFEFKIRK